MSKRPTRPPQETPMQELPPAEEPNAAPVEVVAESLPAQSATGDPFIATMETVAAMVERLEMPIAAPAPVPISPLPSTDEPLMSTRDVAKRYGVSEETVRRWIRKGQVPFIMVGPSRVKRIERRQIERRSS